MGFLFADADVEDCAVLRREAGGRWYDYHCEPSNPMEYHYPYICEFRKIFFFVLLNLYTYIYYFPLFLGGGGASWP
jgi:hypothetical protein